MILKISGYICPTKVVQIQKFQKFMRNTSRDIIRYFSTVASDGIFIHNTDTITCWNKYEQPYAWPTDGLFSIFQTQFISELPREVLLQQATF